jgi:hypothetical protein
MDATHILLEKVELSIGFVRVTLDLRAVTRLEHIT